MLYLAFAALASSVLLVSPGSSVQGTIRSSDSGESISGVMVEAVDRSAVTWTDSAGRYTLGGMSSGAHVLRVSRLGYESRTAGVFVARDTVLRVDIMLTPRAIRLNEVQVREAGEYGGDGHAPDALAGEGMDLTGRRFAGADLHANPAFGAADVLETLSILPDVATRPEVPTALHVRGGSSDQNLILLDGVPLYNAYHAAGALTALNPDVVSAVSISPGIASARHGGALSSVVTIETREPAPEAYVEARGSLGARSLGQTVGGALPGGLGTVVVSGRATTQHLFPGLLTQMNSLASFGDLFVKGTHHSPNGDLELFSLSSGDRVAFDARIDAKTVGGGVASGGSFDTSPSEASAPARNGFDWQTGTEAIVWRGRRDASTQFAARTWQTRFDASADWAAAAGPVHLASALRHVGIAADASRRMASNVISAGLSGERVQTEYGLRYSGVPDSSIALLPTLTASRVMLTAFLEDEWHPAPRWTLTLGGRGVLGAGGSHDVDPRASLRFAPRPRLAFSAGYARTHQYVQSLRNEESVVDAVVGIAFPVVAGTRGVPVARSDVLTLAADSYLGAGTTLRLAAYTRRFDGLLLVAPTTGQPFAMAGFSRGIGQASGLTAMLDWRGERISGHAGYALGTSRRQAAGLRYRSSVTASHAVRMAIRYRPRIGTVLRAALWSSMGRPASVVDGELEWAPHDLLGGTDEMAGTPERIVGALNGERLPAYARLDLGARQEWRPSVNGRSARITAVLNIVNVLNRTNALGRALAADDRTRLDIPMAPRSLRLGLEWRL